MCSCHENKGGDGGGGGEKKTVLFKKDREAPNKQQRGKKQSPVIAFAIRQSVGDSKCTAGGVGRGQGWERREGGVGGGGHAANQSRTLEPSSLLGGECVWSRSRPARGGFISRQTRQTTDNILSAKDASANTCGSIHSSVYESRSGCREIRGSRHRLPDSLCLRLPAIGL